MLLYPHVIYAMSAADKEKYERKGLSQVEWEMIQDARMPDKKVDELLKSGITISEYFRYPWLKFGISEQEWIKSRRSGLLDSDIAAENRPRGDSEGGKVITAFLFPGLHQFKRKVFWKGAIMTSVAVGSAAVCGIRSAQDRAFVFAPLLFLFPTMLWSSIDIGFAINKERNPDAQRFSNTDNENNNLRFSFYIKSN